MSGLHLFNNSVGGQPGPLQLIFARRAHCSNFGLQLFYDRLQCRRAFCSCFLESDFQLLSLDDFILQLFVDRFRAYPRLIQLFFGCLALGKFNLQLFSDVLQLLLPLGKLRLQLLNGSCSGTYFMFQPLFSSMALGSTFNLQLFYDGLQFQSALCCCLLQAAFRLPSLGNLSLKLLNGSFGMSAFSGELSLQLFIGRFDGRPCLFKVLFSSGPLGQLSPQ